MFLYTFDERRSRKDMQIKRVAKHFHKKITFIFELID